MNLLLCLALVGQTWAPLPPPANIRVHDGDTITVDFPGLPEVFGKNIGVRLLGIDTPELRDPNPIVKAYAYKAREYLILRVKAAKTLEIKAASRDKFFRMDGRLYLDDIDIQQELIARGYAKPYFGDKKSPWTVADVANMQPLNGPLPLSTGTSHAGPQTRSPPARTWTRQARSRGNRSRSFRP